MKGALIRTRLRYCIAMMGSVVAALRWVLSFLPPLVGGFLVTTQLFERALAIQTCLLRPETRLCEHQCSLFTQHQCPLSIQQL